MSVALQADDCSATTGDASTLDFNVLPPLWEIATLHGIWMGGFDATGYSICLPNPTKSGHRNVCVQNMFKAGQKAVDILGSYSSKFRWPMAVPPLSAAIHLPFVGCQGCWTTLIYLCNTMASHSWEWRQRTMARYEVLWHFSRNARVK